MPDVDPDWTQCDCGQWFPVPQTCGCAGRPARHFAPWSDRLRLDQLPTPDLGLLGALASDVWGLAATLWEYLRMPKD